MLATYKENCESAGFFSCQKCSHLSRIVYLQLCRIVMAISRAHSFRQFSVIFFRDIVSRFDYVIWLTIVLIVSHFSNSAEFSGNI